MKPIPWGNARARINGLSFGKMKNLWPSTSVWLVIIGAAIKYRWTYFFFFWNRKTIFSATRRLFASSLWREMWRNTILKGEESADRLLRSAHLTCRRHKHSQSKCVNKATVFPRVTLIFASPRGNFGMQQMWGRVGLKIKAMWDGDLFGICII